MSEQERWDAAYLEAKRIERLASRSFGYDCWGDRVGPDDWPNNNDEDALVFGWED